MIAGFYHEGYEDPLLMLMRRRTVHAGLVVKVSAVILFWCLFWRTHQSVLCGIV
jgi:ABC-type uncharacterized transport system permease subunit